MITVPVYLKLKKATNGSPRAASVSTVKPACENDEVAIFFEIEVEDDFFEKPIKFGTIAHHSTPEQAVAGLRRINKTLSGGS